MTFGKGGSSHHLTHWSSKKFGPDGLQTKKKEGRELPITIFPKLTSAVVRIPNRTVIKALKWMHRRAQNYKISFEPAKTLLYLFSLHTSLWFSFLPPRIGLFTSFHHTWPLTHVCVNPEVDLSDNSLGDYGARAMAGMLKENSTLVNLNLSGNNFTDRSVEHLGSAIITNTKLQHLDLSHNSLGEHAGSIAIRLVKVSYFYCRLSKKGANVSHFYQVNIKDL